MQRMSVDLPEPDGPQMTMRSPFLTVRLMFLRTWNCPYHLLTPSSLTITSSVICMAGVNKWYGQFHVLKNINLTVKKGERIVICGPSQLGSRAEACDMP